MRLKDYPEPYRAQMRAERVKTIMTLGAWTTIVSYLFLLMILSTGGTHVQAYIAGGSIVAGCALMVGAYNYLEFAVKELMKAERENAQAAGGTL